MSEQSAIEWTQSTWNPVTGCTEVSPGCDHCYAVPSLSGSGEYRVTHLSRDLTSSSGQSVSRFPCSGRNLDGSSSVP